MNARTNKSQKIATCRARNVFKIANLPGLDSQNQTWDLSCRYFHYCDDDGDDDGYDDGDDVGDDDGDDGKVDDDPGC